MLVVYVSLYLGCAIIVSANVDGPQLSQQMFVLSAWNDTFNGSILETRLTKSKLQCATVCHSKPRCVGFNVNRQRCQLLSDEGHQPSVITDQSEFYKKITKTENNDPGKNHGVNSTADPNESSKVNATAETNGVSTSTSSQDLTSETACKHNTSSYPDAVKFCKDFNTLFIPPTNGFRIAAMTFALRSCSSDPECTYWIGLYSVVVNKTSVRWKWADSNVQMTKNWENGQPPPDDQLTQQTHYVIANCSTGKWRTTTEQLSPRHYICLTNKDGITYTRSWTAHMNHCKNITNSTLASVSTEERVNKIQKLMSLATTVDSGCNYWIGLSAKAGSGWQWTNGDHYNYTNWAENQPPPQGQLDAKMHFAYADCATGKWTATPNQGTNRFARCETYFTYDRDF